MAFTELQFVILAGATLLALLLVVTRSTKRLNTQTFAFGMVFLVLSAVLDLYPGILFQALVGRTSLHAVYTVPFDVLLLAGILFVYYALVKQYEMEERISSLTRTAALREVKGTLLSMPEPKAGAQRLTVLITARNEEETIGQVLASIPASTKSLEIKTIVVDDGSTDKTEDIALRAGAIVIKHGISLGIGAPMTTGFIAALQIHTDYLMHMDADGQHNADEFFTLLQPLLSGEADMVTASRFLSGKPTHLSSTRKAGVRFYTWLVNTMAGYNLTDTTTGYWAIKGGRLRDIMFLSNTNYAVEMMLRAGHNGVRIQEAAIDNLPRNGGHSQFHDISLFFLYHLRVVAQIYRAYSSKKPSYSMHLKVVPRTPSRYEKLQKTD